MLALASLAVVLLFFVPGGVRVGVPASPPASLATRIQWVGAPVAGSTTARLPARLAEIMDPSLMSLPSDHGFSRPMTTRSVPAAPRSLGWQNDAAYLGATPSTQFPALLRQPPLAALVQSATAPALPAPADADEAVTIESPAAVNQTVVRALGPLASQAIVRGPVLPVIVSESPVRPTRVRVGVAADGTVRFAALERASGNEVADARAVELARQIRFEPVAGAAPEALTWDVLRFLWATELPAAAAAKVAPAIRD